MFSVALKRHKILDYTLCFYLLETSLSDVNEPKSMPTGPVEGLTAAHHAFSPACTCVRGSSVLTHPIRSPTHAEICAFLFVGCRM